MPIPSSKWLSVQNIASQLVIDRRLVLAKIHRGELLAYDVSDGESRPMWRVRPEDLEAWLSSRRARPANYPTRAEQRRKKKGEQAEAEAFFTDGTQ